MNIRKKMAKKRFFAILLSTFIIVSIAFPNSIAKADSWIWNTNNRSWNYVNSNGSKQNGWIYVQGKWYYLNENGDMKIGWAFINGKWYYLNSNGDMASGWNFIGGNWYYLKTNGEMVASAWINCNGKSYYLNSNGDMAINTMTPDGYVVDEYGAWTGQVKHDDEVIYNFNIEDKDGQNYTINIISDDNFITRASMDPIYNWNYRWSGAWEGERISRGRYKMVVSKQGENDSKTYPVNNNEETILNLDRPLIRVHKNIENGQPDFLIMGQPQCSNASEIKIYYIKDGKLVLAKFAEYGKVVEHTYTFNCMRLFFRQKENNVFEISSYDNTETCGFYISSYKFNLSTGQFDYMNTIFMDRDEYFNYVR